MGFKDFNPNDPSATIYYHLGNCLNNGGLDVVDLRQLIIGYGFNAVWNTFKTFVADKSKLIAVSDVITEAAKSNYVGSDAVAQQFFNDAYLYLLYKKVFNTDVSGTGFYSVGNATTSASAGRSANTADDNWAHMLMGFAVPGSGNAWVAAVTNYRLPVASFKLSDITNNSGAISVSDQTNDSSFRLASGLAPVFYQVSPSGFGLNTTDQLVALLKKGAQFTLPTTTSNTISVVTAADGLLKTDLPSLSVAQAATYLTGLDVSSSTSAALNTLTAQNISDIANLSSSRTTPGSNAILVDLNNLGAGTAATATRLSIVAIGAAALTPINNVEIQTAIRGLTYNQAWAYVPSTVALGLPVNLARNQYESADTSDVWLYDNAVKQIVRFMDLVGIQISDLIDLYNNRGTSSVVNDFSTIKTALLVSAIGPCTAISKASDYTSNPVGGAPSKRLVNVLGAVKHYSRTAATDFSGMKDAQSIAAYISDDFTKFCSVSSTSIQSTTATLGLNDADGLFDAYLAQCGAVDRRTRPSLKVDDIYDALVLIARCNIGINNLSQSPNSVIKAWLGISNVVRTDIPANTVAVGGVIQTSDIFWGLSAVLDDYEQDDNVKRALASYILNASTYNGQKFFLLDEPANDKYFAKMIQASGSVQISNGAVNPVQLYGLDAAVSPSTGFISYNWGDNDSCMRALAGVSGVTKDLEMSVYIQLYVSYYVAQTSTTSSGVTTTTAAHQSEGFIKYWTHLELFINKYGLKTISNLSRVPEDKAGTLLITPTSTTNTGITKLFTDSGNYAAVTTSAYPNMTAKSPAAIAFNRKLLHVATMLDMANAADFDSSNGQTNSQAATHVGQVLDALDDATVKNFYEYYVNFVGGNAASSNNSPFIFQNMNTNLIQNRIYTQVGKYGKTSQWREAICKADENICKDSSAIDINFDDALDVSASLDSAIDLKRLTLSKSNHMKKIAELIRYQLEKKIPFVDPSTLVAETMDRLESYVERLNAQSSPQLLKLNVLGLVAASKSGGKNIINQAEYDDLLAAGLLAETVYRCVVAVQTVAGHRLGNIAYDSLIGYDADGNVQFDN
jgi:hypothetical protein